MLAAVRWRPTLLLVLAVGLVAATAAAPARAVPTASLPPDLQMLLTAGSSLSPAQITVRIRSHDAARPTDDATVRYATSNAAQGEELTLTDGVQTADSRFLDGREYDSAPGLSRLTRNHRWVYQPGPALLNAPDPAGVLDRDLQTRLERLVAGATSVTETGPTTVAGQAATGFSLVVVPNAQPVVVDIAPSGQLLSLTAAVPNLSLTASVSTDAPVQVTAPPAKISIALAHVPRNSRAQVLQEIQAVRISEGSC